MRNYYSETHLFRVKNEPVPHVPHNVRAWHLMRECIGNAGATIQQMTDAVHPHHMMGAARGYVLWAIRMEYIA